MCVDPNRVIPRPLPFHIVARAHRVQPVDAVSRVGLGSRGSSEWTRTQVGMGVALMDVRNHRTSS